MNTARLTTWWLIVCLCLTGCVQTSKPNKPIPNGTVSLEETAYQSFQNADLLRAELLLKAADDIDAGRLKYDKPCQDRMADIFKSSVEKTWGPTAKALQDTVGEGDWNAAKMSAAFRQLAAGSRRAGAKSER